MLSYRHAFHAGNHADLFKHFVLTRLLSHLNQKDKPYWFIDTHAGAGCYQLDSGYAAKNAEFQGGIGRLWTREDLPPVLAGYVALVRALNDDGELRFYPGSPVIALEMLRRTDRLRLFELHNSDFPLLEANLAGAGRRAMLFHEDGFAGLKGLLPPTASRALTLIDPSYEQKDDYTRVVSCLREALKRFATGVYMVWRPILDRDEARELPLQLEQLSAKSWLHVSLTVAHRRDEGPGMTGSGLFIINPPWTLHDELQSTLPFLRDALAVDDGAGYEITRDGE